MPKRKKTESQLRREDRERKRLKRSDVDYKEAEQARNTSIRQSKRLRIEHRQQEQERDTSRRRSERLKEKVRSREQEQDTNRRRSRRLDEDVRRHEQEQNTNRRRSTRLSVEVRQQEQTLDTTRRRLRRLGEDVRRHEQEQNTNRRRSTRLSVEVRQQEQTLDTTRRRLRRLDESVRRNEQTQDTTRRRSRRLGEDVRRHEQEQNTNRRRSTRLSVEVRQQEQTLDTTRRRSRRLDENVRRNEQTLDTRRRQSKRLNAETRNKEKEQNTASRRAKRLVDDARRKEQIQNTSRRKQVRSDPVLKENENLALRRRRQATRRLFASSYDKLHNEFQAKKRSAPVHICSCCGGLWYKESVSSVTENQLNSWGVDVEIRNKCLCYEQNPHLLCRTCKESVRKNKVPRLALSNGLMFPELPEELKDLSPLEERCIAPRLPFSKIKLVGTERQSTLNGCVINVENDLDICAKVIPRQMTETSVVEVKLMRRMRDKTPYMWQKVRPYKIYKAAKYMVQTPAYIQENVELSQDWRFSVEGDTQDFGSTTDEEVAETSETDSDDASDIETDVPTFPCEESFIFNDKDSLTKGIRIAPGEGHTPRPLYQDLRAEELAFPKIFGGQIRDFKDDLHLTYTDLKKSELRMYDRRTCTVDHIFYAYNKSRIEKIFNALQIFLRKTPGNTTMTAGEIRRPGCLESIVNKDEGYSVFKEIRCTPPYWQQKTKEVVAMVRTLGTSTMFLTLSAAETKWTELIVMLVKVLEGNDITEEEAAALPYSKVCELIRKDPVTCMRHFDHRYRAFYNQMLLKVNGVFEDVQVTDYFSRMEFQMRGSPHLHSLLWMKDAPKLDFEDPTSVVECTNFIDRFITCERNEEGDMKKLLAYQLHNHSHTCYKNRRGKDHCRFGFPKPPMERTRFLHPFTENDNPDRILRAKENFKRLQERLNNMGRDFEDVIPFDEFLDSLDLDKEEYIDAIRSSIKRVTPFLKRDTNAIFINQYNEKILKEWEANIDLQFVTDSYACAKYCVGYILKAESGVSKLLRAAAEDARKGNLSVKEKLKKFARILITGTEISAQEAVAFLLGISFTSCSRNVVYVSTSPPLERVRMLRSKEDLEKLDESSTDILAKGLLEHYIQRPVALENICLADFATMYEYQKRQPASRNDSEEPSTPSSTKCQFYKLIDGSGFVRERRIRKILRFRHYRKNDNTGNYWREQLMLFVPWRNESEELNNSNAESVAKSNMNLIISNSQPYYYNRSIDEDDLGRIIEEAEEEDQEREPIVENEMGFHVDVDDYNDYVNQELSRESEGIQPHRVESFTKPGRVTDEEYLKIMRELNDKQRRFVLNVIHQQKVSTEPFYYFLSGGAGVGKSRVIHAIVQYYLRNESSHITDPEEICVLVSAPTGKAAHNVYGMTLHTSFKFPSSQGMSKRPGKLNDSSLNTLRRILRNVKLFIIDEISMVSSNFLYYIDARLQDIFNSKKDFGGKSVIVVGHMRQLAPVHGRYVFLPPKFDETQGVEDILHNYLWDNFKFYELDEIMRQRGEHEFCQALNRMSEGCMLDEDIHLINSRKITETNAPPKDTIWLFATRKACDDHNAKVLQELNTDGAVAIAHDVVQGHASEKTKRELLEYAKNLNPQKSDGLPYSTFLKVGGCYFISTNVDVQDGLFNGSTGFLKKIEFATAQSQERIPRYAWMLFDDALIGSSARARTADFQRSHSIPASWTRIERDQRSLSGVFSFNRTNRVNLELIREQIPLVAANGMTIHKSQGSSMSSVVVSMNGLKSIKNFRELLYVACSRATSLNGLFIDGDFVAPKAPKADDKVTVALEDLNRKPVEFPFLLLQDVDVSKERFYYHNVNSITGKIDDVLSDQCAMSASLLAFVEPWLVEDDEVVFPNFSCIHKSFCGRPRNSEGFLVLSAGGHFCSDYQMHRGTVPNSQCQFLVIQAESMRIVLTYRHPKFPFHVYLEYLKQNLRNFSTIDTVIIGDANIDLRKQVGLQLTTVLQEYGFESKIDLNCPTHDNNRHIDLCFSNSGRVTASIYESYYSDHKPICLVW